MDEEKKKKGGMGWIVVYIILFIAFIGIGFAVSFALPKMISEERTFDITTLKSEIKEINELATLQYDYREVIEYQKDKIAEVLDKKIKTGKAIFIATFDGRIKAGIDLNNVDYDIDKPEDGSNEGAVVTVSIPEAKILSHEDMNPETLYEEGLNSSGLGKLRNNAIKEKKKAAEKKFISDGKLDEAKGQAKSAIEDFIHNVYGDDIEVEFKDK